MKQEEISPIVNFIQAAIISK